MAMTEHGSKDMQTHSVRKGDIVWLDFERKAGAPIKKTRPGLVVQNDLGNQFAPHTIIAAIRGDVKKGLPVQVSVPKGTAGLTKDSVIDCGFLATVSKDKLGGLIGKLPLKYMGIVNEALRVSLGLR
ncbi:type II toxin-antitoxin system PemK/MazF family toxin [Elusimicrobiota bacterium]